MTPEQLFESNQRLAYWVISKKFNDMAHDPDTIQEAMIALWAGDHMQDGGGRDANRSCQA